MIRILSRGSNKTSKSLENMKQINLRTQLDAYGQAGVTLLSAATPIDTGLTAYSWNYRIVNTRRGPSIEWFNTNQVDGTPVAILIQYGHGTKNGGYVVGRDFINPAMQPLFDRIAYDVWKKVTSA